MDGWHLASQESGEGEAANPCRGIRASSMSKTLDKRDKATWT